MIASPGKELATSDCGKLGNAPIFDTKVGRIRGSAHPKKGRKLDHNKTGESLRSHLVYNQWKYIILTISVSDSRSAKALRPRMWSCTRNTIDKREVAYRLDIAPVKPVKPMINRIKWICTYNLFWKLSKDGGWALHSVFNRSQWTNLSSPLFFAAKLFSAYRGEAVSTSSRSLRLISGMKHFTDASQSLLTRSLYCRAISEAIPTCIWLARFTILRYVAYPATPAVITVPNSIFHLCRHKNFVVELTARTINMSSITLYSAASDCIFLRREMARNYWLTGWKYRWEFNRRQ